MAKLKASKSGAPTSEVGSGLVVGIKRKTSSVKPRLRGTAWPVRVEKTTSVTTRRSDPDDSLVVVVDSAAIKGVVSSKQRSAFSRSKLVGKFPEIRHLPAPQGPHRITEEDRRKLLAAMALL